MTAITVSLKRIVAYISTGVQSTSTQGGAYATLMSDLETAFRNANASASRKGFVELATDAESYAVTDSTRAVTPHGLGAALAKLYVISFAGKNGAGACTATGVAVNDVIFGVAGLTTVGQLDASFEAVVTVANQIQQLAAGDLSTKNFLALIYRPA
jgi:hypothetical protein